MSVLKGGGADLKTFEKITKCPWKIGGERSKNLDTPLMILWLQVAVSILFFCAKPSTTKFPTVVATAMTVVATAMTVVATAMTVVATAMICVQLGGGCRKFRGGLPLSNLIDGYKVDTAIYICQNDGHGLDSVLSHATK